MCKYPVEKYEIYSIYHPHFELLIKGILKMKKTLLAIFVANICTLSAHANTNESTSKQTEMLDTIVVLGTPFSQKVGTQKLSEEQIKNRPIKDGNITELFKSNPNVVFSNTADTSTSAGEIAPNEISVHGEKFYNNNYTIDGISNNNNMDPESNNKLTAGGNNVGGYSPTDMPSSGTQAFWLDTHLLKNVEVFDSNISAKYGRFTGGVINAEIKDPALDASHGRIFYRTTRDSWADFHFQEGDEESYNRAENLGDQPQFKKEQYGISVSQPVSDKASLLFSYNRNISKIPYHHSYLGEWVNQKRESETYLLKGTYLPDNGDLWKATVMYAPHKSTYYKKNIKNGGFTNTGGGLSLNLQWEKNFDWGKMLSSVSYKKIGDETEHDSTNFYNYTYASKGSALTNKGWCSNTNCASAQEGGYGRFGTDKQTYTFKQDYEFNSFGTGPLEHKINVGWEINKANAKFSRYTTTDSVAYVARTNRTTITRYDEHSAYANDTNYAAYLEDSIKWRNLTTTLGMRMDRSEYLGNTDFAPRFSTSYDVFGDQSTQLFGGASRYYSDTVLSYKLRNMINAYRRSSDNGATWAYNSGNSYDVSKLDTPYSDEYVAGISQKVLGADVTFKYVKRFGKDQFVRTATAERNALGVRTYYMTNDGRSKTESYTLQISPEKPYEFSFAKVSWAAGGMIRDSKTNYSTYASSSTGSNYADMAIYNGKLVPLTGLPPRDYNTPWSAFFELNTEFPNINLNWNQRFSYSAGYTGYTTGSTTCPGHNSCGSYDSKGVDVLTYDEYKQGNFFMLDWNFAYKLPTFQKQYLEVTLDINNVLNRKVIASTSGSSSTYKMGRNFWLGASYNW